MNIYQNLLKSLRISRPHIWIYTLGSFLFGVQIASLLHYQIPFWNTVFLSLLLTVPINYVIYAINDYYDSPSDILNPKKVDMEYKALAEEKVLLYSALVILIAVTGFFIFTQNSLVIFLYFIWLLSVILYNMPPFRFKAIPGLDMVCAIIYPIWGLIGYISTGAEIHVVWFVLSAFLLSCSFHLYSAISDIDYDKNAGIITSAVYLHSLKANIGICIGLVILSVIPLYNSGLYITALTILIYAVFYAAHFAVVKLPGINLVQMYRYFIYLHYLIGIIASTSLILYI